jgi:hypothetical protein
MTTLQREIKKAKNKLIKKAQNSRLYEENFGQKEVRTLLDKFGYNESISQFSSWAMCFDLNNLKKEAKS